MKLHLHDCPADAEHDICERQGGPEHAHCVEVIHTWQRKADEAERTHDAMARQLAQTLVENRQLRIRLVDAEEQVARARLGIGEMRAPRAA